jgi:hypothetical protein
MTPRRSKYENVVDKHVLLTCLARFAQCQFVGEAVAVLIKLFICQRVLGQGVGSTAGAGSDHACINASEENMREGVLVDGNIWSQLNFQCRYEAARDLDDGRICMIVREP